MPEREIMVCGVCGRALDSFEPEDGSERRYLHTFGDQIDEDHPAVPIPQADMQGIPRCDFCHGDYPDWQFDVPDLPGPMPGTVSAGNWAACTTCKDLIERGLWNKIHQRAKESHEMRHGPMSPVVEAGLRGLHRMLRKHITTSARPNPAGKRPGPPPG